ncbi:hypothetical protein F5Y19DRAFT_125246 [Xylariaceae sp. FL1651]|nr:hypothetical protein F5Y19DRAFT_125246 [Xylariaceae sp. FL1651]
MTERRPERLPKPTSYTLLPSRTLVSLILLTCTMARKRPRNCLAAAWTCGNASRYCNFALSKAYVEARLGSVVYLRSFSIVRRVASVIAIVANRIGFRLICSSAHGPLRVSLNYRESS